MLVRARPEDGTDDAGNPKQPDSMGGLWWPRFLVKLKSK